MTDGVCGQDGEVFLDSGEVKACRGGRILQASAIGSCVVVAAYDPDSAVGGMAHVMLPGESGGQDSSTKTKYARDAVEEMMRMMSDLGAKEARVRVSLLGGGNALGDGHDSPGPDIVRSLAEIPGRKGITPVAMEVGGTRRRFCAPDVARGRETPTEGESRQGMLWEAKRCGLGSADKRSRSSPKEVIS